jgi:hypothetical protein
MWLRSGPDYVAVLCKRKCGYQGPRLMQSIVLQRRIPYCALREPNLSLVWRWSLDVRFDWAIKPLPAPLNASHAHPRK